ncbi:MAG: AAA family ATPase [Anaerolineales bacterium]|nr:MAG: AAA family ATPase [Anaerolineales bacterium]
MKADNPINKREQLEQAIAAQEGLRGILDDAIVDATIAALRKQLAELSPEPVVEQHRKQVTILFMDVVGSTKLMGALDPEENLAIMDTALQDLAAPVNAHGGRVTRFMGDGFLAVFGLPKARENDPEMAVRAGLGILETATLIAQDLKEKLQIEGFQVRIGVNTGLVVAGGVTEADGTLMGAAVNLAARLESAAPPGGLLISQHTYAHVRGIFDLFPGQSISMKGFSEPVQVYQVKRAKPHSFRFKTRGIEGVETPMIGRGKELKALQDSLDTLVHLRKSQSITVVGEAGLGKSRLLDEFENWLENQPTKIYLFKGRATLDTLDIPYALLRDIFASHFAILDDDPVPAVRKKIVDRFKDAFGGAKEYKIKAHFVGQLLGYDFRDSPYLKGVLESPQQIRDRALVYLIDLIKAYANRIPVIIFLDDIHWADDSSLDILERMNDELATQQVLFVALTRPSLFERRPSWGSKLLQQRLELQPLSHLESEHLLKLVLQKVQGVPGQLFELIVRNAEGNPFYLEELVMMLVEESVIVKSEPAWRVQSDRLLELHIPPTLTGVIQARLDRLPVYERKVLQQASVVGKVFWDAAISYINRDIQSAGIPSGPQSLDIAESLNTLQLREMILQRNESAFSDTVEYLFSHTILQEVTYESVLKRTRRLYHAMVADWLILQSGDRVGEFTGLIAGHLEKAGKNKAALEYMCQAAEMAASNYAIDEAADFYTRAIALAPEDDLERRYTLLIGQETIYSLQGNRDGQREILETLATIVDTLADERKRVELLMLRAWFGFWTSEFPEGLASAHKAVTLSETIGDQSLSRQAYYVWAWMLHQKGDADLSIVQAQIALSIARQAGDRRAEGNTLNILGLNSLAKGDFFTGLGYLEGFLTIAREIGDLEREITALNNLGVVLTRLGDYQAARDNFQQILTIVLETGNRSAEGTAHTNLGWVAAAQGEWDLARKYCELGVAKKREQEQVEAMAEGLHWLGHAWLGLSQSEKAVDAYRQSLAVRQKLNQPHLAMGVRAGLAQAALAQGDLANALYQTNEILSYLAAGGSLQATWEPLRIYLTCYQVLQLAGDPQAGEILETAFNLLQDQASRIPDQAYKRLFLENISWHREIISTWEARHA